MRLHYAIEPEPRDTAGAIRFAATDAGITERFLVLNGDILTDLDVGTLVAEHEQGAEATIALHRVEDPSDFGVVPTDGDHVTAFIEKPPRRGTDRPHQRRHVRPRGVGVDARRHSTPGPVSGGRPAWVASCPNSQTRPRLERK